VLILNIRKLTSGQLRHKSCLCLQKWQGAEIIGVVGSIPYAGSNLINHLKSIIMENSKLLTILVEVDEGTKTPFKAYNEIFIMNKKEIMNEKEIIETLFRNLLIDQLKLYGLNFQIASQSLNVVSEDGTVLFQIELSLAAGGYLLECEVRHCDMKLKYLDNAANEILYEYRDEIIEFLTK